MCVLFVGFCCLVFVVCFLWLVERVLLLLLVVVVVVVVEMVLSLLLPLLKMLVSQSVLLFIIVGVLFIANHYCCYCYW